MLHLLARSEGEKKQNLDLHLIRQWRWSGSCRRSYVDCCLRRFHVYEQPIGPKSSITST